ncbi:MAG: FtsW/RodA/SpoVE family cell cycle protein [Clostridiales bacterium]|nr:FtsW/RodA/SpoVE family cell cycle protein [Clostridiales bacterium]
MAANTSAKAAPKKAAKQKGRIRRPAIRPINNTLMMLLLTVFQVMTAIPVMVQDGAADTQITQIFLFYIIVEWAYLIVLQTLFHRRNFELELLAFFLSGVGMVAIASINPDQLMTQFITLLMGIVLHVIMVFFLGNVDLCMKLRIPVGIGALGLMGVNLIIAGVTNGARNWISIAGFTFQPAEFVKIAFIFVGAATLEKIQTTKNIWLFLGFSAAVVGSLFVIRDFGMALIFFFTFLIIAFMNSGDIRTIIYACAAGVMGAVMIVRYRPHVTSRFESYRKVWEYAYDSGYQQTQVLIGMASGGLFGVGIGNGYVKQVYASTNDLIFGVICEEWGYIFGVAIVLAFGAMAVSALINSVASRSTFYSIAAVAAAGLLLFQACLNIFGITDILPLTGVTLPFVSQGGSSMICCWGLLAFIKASDVRTYNYLGGVTNK